MFDTVQQQQSRRPQGLTLRQRGISAEVRLEDDFQEMQDWSMSGVLFRTGARPLKTGEPVKMTLRFHLPNESVGVWIDGHVLRSDAESTAVQFDGLTSYAERRLARVIDGLRAKEFTH